MINLEKEVIVRLIDLAEEHGILKSGGYEAIPETEAWINERAKRFDQAYKAFHKTIIGGLK